MACEDSNIDTVTTLSDTFLISGTAGGDVLERHAEILLHFS